MTSNSIGLTDLNDECLFKLFKYCSIESLVALAECCSQFRRIIKSKNYENIRDYECEIWVRENEEQFRAELINHGKIFQNIGQYVRSLTIWINSEELPDEDLKIRRDVDIVKLLKHFAKYAGNISKIEFYIEYLNASWLIGLKSLCMNAQSVSFDIISPTYADRYNFFTMFPRVEELQIGGNVSDLGYSVYCPMPTLKSLTIIENDSMHRDKLYYIMLMNPQLEKLSIEMIVGKSLPMASYIPFWKNLVELTMSSCCFDLKSDMGQLKKLKKLNSITFRGVDEYDAESILNGLPALKRLQTIKIYFSSYQNDDESDEEDGETHSPDEYHQQLIKIAQQNKSLEQFHIANCPLTETICLKFAASAKKLREFHFHKCNLNATVEFINKMNNRRKTQLKVISDGNCDSENCQYSTKI